VDGVTGRAGIGQRGSVVGVFSSGIGLDFFKKGRNVCRRLPHRFKTQERRVYC
jgi:hypothetical protein